MLWTGCYLNDFLKDEKQECWDRTKRVLSGVPDNWKGTIYLVSGFVDAFAPFISLDKLQKYWKQLKEFHKYVDNGLVVTLDMYWAQHMRSSAEIPEFNLWFNTLPPQGSL